MVCHIMRTITQQTDCQISDVCFIRLSRSLSLSSSLSLSLIISLSHPLSLSCRIDYTLENPARYFVSESCCGSKPSPGETRNRHPLGIHIRYLLRHQTKHLHIHTHGYRCKNQHSNEVSKPKPDGEEIE